MTRSPLASSEKSVFGCFGMLAAMSLLKEMFASSGRIDRGLYWRVLLLYMGALLILGFIGAFIGFALTGHGYVDLAVPILALSIPISVKRLHDRDKSGWWLIAFFVLPEALNRTDGLDGTGLPLAFSFASAMLSIWAFVELGFLRGTVGPNRFGPDPLAG